MNTLLHPRIGVAANDRLDAWDAEGGACGVAARAPGSMDSAGPATRRLLIERLGGALLDEWHALPTPWRRAIYMRAVAREAATGDPAPLKRSLARLLHDRQPRR